MEYFYATVGLLCKSLTNTPGKNVCVYSCVNLYTYITFQKTVRSQEMIKRSAELSKSKKKLNEN